MQESCPVIYKIHGFGMHSISEQPRLICAVSLKHLLLTNITKGGRKQSVKKKPVWTKSGNSCFFVHLDFNGESVGSGRVQMVDCSSCFFVPQI